MPWIRERPKPHTRDSGAFNLSRSAQEALADAERNPPAAPANRQRHLKEVLDVVARATRDTLNAMIDAERQGYEVPTTKILIADHGKTLPKAARDELRDFIDEMRPVVMSGDRGRPRQAAREFNWEISEGLVNIGWRAPQKEIDPNETPDVLASLIPRG